MSPDGKTGICTSETTSMAHFIDTADRKVVANVLVGSRPRSAAFKPDGSELWITSEVGGGLSIIDPATRKLIRTVAVGTVPIQIYATPDSATLLVANQGTRDKPGKTVSFIDLTTFEIATTVETGAGAHGVAIDGAGRYAYVTNSYANTVSVIDLADRKVVATVPVGKGPNGISVFP